KRHGAGGVLGQRSAAAEDGAHDAALQVVGRGGDGASRAGDGSASDRDGADGLIVARDAQARVARNGEVAADRQGVGPEQQEVSGADCGPAAVGVARADSQGPGAGLSQAGGAGDDRIDVVGGCGGGVDAGAGEVERSAGEGDVALLEEDAAGGLRAVDGNSEGAGRVSAGGAGSD